MRQLVQAVHAIGYAALLLTAWNSIAGARRHRDLRRLDILLVVGSLVAVSPVGSGVLAGNLVTIRQLVALLFPYFLLRLIQHFRHVPVAVTAVAIGAPLAVLLLRAVTPLPWPAWQQYLLSGYLFVALVLVAFTFSAESRRSAGVTAKRLAFAALGTWLVAAIHSTTIGATRWDLDPYSAATLSKILSTGALVSYYLAFATPRWLRKNWQQMELARYLVSTADREADERAGHAADDLLQAAQRGAAGSAVFVALRDTITSDDVTVRASTHQGMIGVALEPEAGPADMTARVAESAIVPLASLEGQLRDKLARTGETVLLAPISSSAQRWGVVGVVQRRGSLFPPDDLRLLEQFGQYAGGMLDHGQLVTEARLRERQAADRRLREVESRMSLMLDTITDYAILIVDDRGCVVNWPVGAGVVFGFAEADILDSSAAALFGMTDAEFLQTLADAGRAGGVAREHECTRHDGTRFFATTHIRRLDPGVEDLRGFVIVTRDITTRRDMEDRLRQGQKMEALGRLAGGVAHDFNNLLTVIMGYTELLANELAETDQAPRDSVNEIQKASTRAAGLTRQLLAFSRHQIIQPAVLDITQVIDGVLPMLQRTLGEHITIRTETVGQVPSILADRGQLEQVILNLAVNARDAMPTGGTLTIRVALEHLTAPLDNLGLSAGEWVRLDVRDTGHGMDPATRTRIFEPFFTTKPFGRGTGLGLATVYGVVRQMGGVVHVDSTVGLGSTFSLYMRPTTLLTIETVPTAETKAQGGSETVLLVEDEPGVSRMLAHVLEGHGYRLLVADAPAEAHELVRTHGDEIDLIVTDVVMPGGSGPELVQQLRETRPGLRAIFISGYADATLSRQGLPPGAEFLQKPFSGIDLLIKVRRLLTRP